ncbi:transglutaminase TgpA family protein [Mucisphaera calidilacus]|uniref:Protein-glutamine gamma-glutamyltransferase n=1 Tax=Mucisphaera calidilacus TaxID=2527982 RepID=A0A518BZN7_9BACT|nr:transglutaminaseTgpA domain-containing protein [Mucisphaera calidilacus]QDU72436.1 Protein-glutamine gamma-glutamyltransferase [Mucisphaera calidilacus]
MRHDGRRLLFIQVMLGVLTLCIALGDPLLLAGALLVGSFGWWWFEHVVHRRLPGWIVTAGGLAALGMLLFEHLVLKQRMVMAMAHFTLVLQGLLVFGHKRLRDTIALMTISLIQVIIASVVSVSMVFGVLMLSYCFLLTWTLSRLQVELALERRHTGHASREDLPRLSMPVGLRLWTAGVVAGCLVVGLMFFLLIPRSERGPLASRIHASLMESASGYSERVDVTTSPEFQGSDEAVLRLRVTAHGELFRGAGQVYLMRGMVFDQYDAASHQWLRGVDAQARYQHVALKMGQAQLARVTETGGMLEGQVTLRRRTQEGLFTVLPTVSISSPNVAKIEFNPLDQVVRTPQSGTPGGALTYRIQWPFYGRLDVPGAYFDHLDAGPGTNRLMRFSERQADRYARGWPVDEDQIRALALSILERRGLTRDPDLLHHEDDWQIANALASELRDRFRYMRFNPRPKSGVDPVTLFLTGHNTGHCELFASGLAGLCRSVGIPARLVVGYRVSEYNDSGAYYVAREKHAHAWVEVATEPMSGWRPLDGTPVAEIEALHAMENTWSHRLRSYYEYLEFTWIGSIVVYDERARDLLVTWARNVPLAAADLASAFRGLYERLSTWFAMMTGSSLTLWAGIGVGLFGVAVGYLALGLRRDQASLERLGLDEGSWAENRARIRQLRFYLRMIAMLEAHGYRRPSWQTPGAFAEELSEANPLRFGPVIALTDLFYAVRFGGAGLSEADALRAEAHLSALAQGLAVRASRH